MSENRRGDFLIHTGPIVRPTPAIVAK